MRTNASWRHLVQPDDQCSEPRLGVGVPEEVVALKRPTNQPEQPVQVEGKRRTTLQQWRRRLAVFTFIPFVILQMMAVFVIFYWPELATWLPAVVYK